MWVSLLRVPYRMLFPAILLFCCIGLFSVNRLPADIYFMAAFGIIGLGMVKLGFEPAPLLLGLVLGDALEANFRRALILSGGDYTTFFNSWISITFLILAGFMLLLVLVPAFQQTRGDSAERGRGLMSASSSRKNGVARAPVPAIPPFLLILRQTWMPATSAGMTKKQPASQLAQISVDLQPVADVAQHVGDDGRVLRQRAVGDGREIDVILQRLVGHLAAFQNA